MRSGSEKCRKKKKINADWRVKMRHVEDCLDWVTRE
ncbi:PREDICTED: uncharacterized protein LOC109125664 [Camelina sativa]|uniref:Uncharacterized protein LOC109125664 n=1 Tax=Camelina sativa TaxID=90675 RepID=A0ABM1Q9D5_CAMSA|nr:PREDICTED: uncharacterized protein LOC109125664 [Camelina sativa]